jgi:hypothetical protein
MTPANPRLQPRPCALLRPAATRCLLIVTLLLATDCGRFDDGVGILNHSGTTLDFYYITDEGEQRIGTNVPAGRSFVTSPRPMPGRCAVGHIEARLPDGRVVKRLDPPFCYGDDIEVHPEDLPPDARHPDPP